MRALLLLLLASRASASVPTEASIREDVAAARDRLTLHCAPHGDVRPLLVYVVGEPEAMTVTTSAPGAFARCVANYVQILANQSDERLAEPQRLWFGMELTFGSPQELLEDKVDAFSPICTGEDRATLAVTVDERGLAVRVTTAEPEVAACLEYQLRQWLWRFPAGRWKLATTRTLTLHARAFSDGHLNWMARQLISSCHPTRKRDGKETTVLVHPGAQGVAVEVSGSERFAACLGEAIRTRLRDSYRGGTYQVKIPTVIEPR